MFNRIDSPFFFANSPNHISTEDEQTLFHEAVTEAFGDKGYLREVHPNALKAFIDRCKNTFDRVLSGRGIGKC